MYTHLLIVLSPDGLVCLDVVSQPGEGVDLACETMFAGQAKGLNKLL
jgi:hypothetical protein